MASAISASKNSWITVRTIGRRKSPSSAIIALISLIVLLLSFRVMVRYSVGCFSLPTAYHDLFFLLNLQDTTQFVAESSIFVFYSNPYHRPRGAGRTHARCIQAQVHEALAIEACRALAEGQKDTNTPEA